MTILSMQNNLNSFPNHMIMNSSGANNTSATTPLTHKQKFQVFLHDKSEQELYLNKAKNLWNYACKHESSSGVTREIADTMIDTHSSLLN